MQFRQQGSFPIRLHKLLLFLFSKTLFFFLSPLFTEKPEEENSQIIEKAFLCVIWMAFVSRKTLSFWITSLSFLLFSFL